MKALGFADVFEVAIGADFCTVQEAEDFVKEVPEQLPFMATSCCPAAWSVMAKKLFPDYSNCISMALTPMTLTARLIRRNMRKGNLFIRRARRKSWRRWTSVRSDVDFVLTFEEMAGIFDARHVDIENIEEDEGGVNAASKDGRNFAVAGGVAKSVVDVIAQMYPEKEIKVANAEGLKRSARNFFSSPKPESTMAIFWKEWHARAAALQVPERCSRSKISGCGKPLCGKSRTCDERQDRVCERTG